MKAQIILSAANICTRCGKPRVVARTWIEEIETYNGKSKVTHTQTVCPDPTCQKIVEERLAERIESSAKAEKERAERKELSNKNATPKNRVHINLSSGSKKSKAKKK